MAEASEALGFKITRPGTRYYFDDAQPKCPCCGSNAVEYHCRVRGTARTAGFKCSSCLCKFEKTRTLDTEPVGYTPEPRVVDVLFAVACQECGHGLNMKLADFEKAERVACRECGAVLKSRTGEQV